ncbi:hypothetical protein C0J52_28194 [Blattella germanica]|nr:hypothetical protein C0J52_28194 [Blattella germanica]
MKTSMGYIFILLILTVSVCSAVFNENPKFFCYKSQCVYACGNKLTIKNMSFCTVKANCMFDFQCLFRGCTANCSLQKLLDLVKG